LRKIQEEMNNKQIEKEKKLKSGRREIR